MVGSKQLSRSEMTIINLGSSGVAWGWPVLLALVVAPVIVRGLGNDAYGVRGLTTLLIGYFALFDLGLNGAVTKYLAEYIVSDDKRLIKELLGTTLSTYIVAGLIGGAVIWSLAGWLTTSVFTVPANLKMESIWAFRITGIGFFFSMLVWWSSAIPAGMQRFDIFNGISIGFGTLTSLGSLVAVLLGFGLLGVIWANVLANIIATVAYFVAARKLLPNIKIRPSFEVKMFKKTTIFGSYMVLFRIFSLLFSQTDRLLIGAMLSPGILTYYIIAHKLSSVVHRINAKMMQIVFPMASEFSVSNKKEKIKKLFLRSMNLSFVVGVGMALPIFALSKPLLTYWMTPEIADKSTLVLQILTIMYLLMGLNAAPSSLLSGIGFPQVATIAAAITGISGLVCYWVSIKLWGINGAALATVVSVAITTIFYLIVSKRLTGVSLLTLGYNAVRPLLIALLIGTTVVKFVVFKISNLWSALMVFVLIVVVYAMACWFVGVFNAEEKRAIRDFTRRCYQASPIKL